MHPARLHPFADKATLKYLIFAFLLGGGVFYLSQRGWNKVSQTMARHSSKKVPQNSSCDYKINRVQGFRNINPVLLIEKSERSERFASMEVGLDKIIEGMKKTGTIKQASVLLKDIDQGEWMDVNPAEKYHPASLMKVPLLLGYLRRAENAPDLFEQQWLFEKSSDFQHFPQYFATKSIEPGKKYTVHELLYYMIAHSDNNATWMLASRLDKSYMKKVFGELGLSQPAEFDMNLTMTVKEYSTFFNAIYNAANLSPEYADYAADLLSNCSFEEGFFKGFPSETRMWHKFGQWKSKDSDHELHESGIVHIKGNPYLITIMTRGKETDKLTEAIQEICRKIYDEIPSP